MQFSRFSFYRIVSFQAMNIIMSQQLIICLEHDVVIRIPVCHQVFCTGEWRWSTSVIVQYGS
jgi:hypothetical protein